jgi:hypothetical protein
MILIDRARTLSVLVLAGGLLFVAACGNDGGTTTAAAPKASSSADPRAAFRQCLQQHGVTLPDQGRSGGGGPPSGRPSGAASGPPSGRPSGRPTGMRSFSDSQRQALQACASLAPGDGGFGGGIDQSALKAFQNCMSQHGVKITNSFRPEARRTADPKFAAAFRTCRPLLPQRSPRAGTPAPSPS